MAYTTGTLATFMVTKLGAAVASALSLTTASLPIVEAVNDVASLLDTAIADLTDDQKTRVIAEWRVWLVAEAEAIALIDLKSSGDEMKLSQLWDHIRARLLAAETAAMVYDEVLAATGAGGVMVIASVGGTQQPYGWASEF
jgi:hypothetical protein